MGALGSSCSGLAVQLLRRQVLGALRHQPLRGEQRHRQRRGHRATDQDEPARAALRRGGAARRDGHAERQADDAGEEGGVRDHHVRHRRQRAGPAQRLDHVRADEVFGEDEEVAADDERAERGGERGERLQLVGVEDVVEVGADEQHHRRRRRDEHVLDGGGLERAGEVEGDEPADAARRGRTTRARAARRRWWWSASAWMPAIGNSAIHGNRPKPSCLSDVGEDGAVEKGVRHAAEERGVAGSDAPRPRRRRRARRRRRRRGRSPARRGCDWATAAASATATAASGATTPTRSAPEVKPMNRPSAARSASMTRSEGGDPPSSRGRPTQSHQPADGERGAEEQGRVGGELARPEQERGRRRQDEAAEERAAAADHARAGVEAGEHGQKRRDRDGQAAAELADAEEAEAGRHQLHGRRRTTDGVCRLRQRALSRDDDARGVGDPDLVRIPEAERAEPREEEHQRQRGQKRVADRRRERAHSGRTFGRHRIHISDGVEVCNDPRRATQDSPGSSQAMRSSIRR